MSNKFSLYDVALEGAEINDILAANDGELTPELEERFDALLRLGPNKIDAACMIALELSATAEACRSEAKRLTDRATSFDRNEATLKSRILGAVDAAFGGKLKTQMFTVWGQNAADTFTVDIAADVDLKKLHEADPELVKVGYSLDKAKCRQLIKDGSTINGVTVTENPGTRYLRIK